MNCELIEDETLNGFLGAVKLAWENHIPLAFSADHIWNLVAQGFGKHVIYNAEKLRSKFVKHKGKLSLTTNLCNGSIDGYESMFKDWTNQIKEHIGKDNYTNLMPYFSTTDQTAQCCHMLSLMHSMKK